MKNCCKYIILIFFLVTSSNVYASKQLVDPSSTSQTVQPSAQISVVVRYSTNPSVETLSGLGLRVHFDSTKLTFQNISNAWGTPVGQDTSAQDDSTTNYDNNTATDKYVGVAWADYQGTNWPGSGVVQPLDLMTVNFTVATNFSGSTRVGFSSSSSATGYEFAATSHSVTDNVSATVTWTLSPGWNLVPYTVDGGYADSGSLITAIQQQTGMTVDNLFGMSSGNLLQHSAFGQVAMTPGHAYLLKLAGSTTSQTFSISGTPYTSLELPIGWSFIGLSPSSGLNGSDSVFTALNTGNGLADLFRFDATNQTVLQHSAFGVFTVTPTQDGLMIRRTSSMTYTP